jgi:hypothetical protein
LTPSTSKLVRQLVLTDQDLHHPYHSQYAFFLMCLALNWNLKFDEKLGLAFKLT